MPMNLTPEERAVCREEDLRLSALHEARKWAGSDELSAHTVVEAAERFLAFLKGLPAKRSDDEEC